MAFVVRGRVDTQTVQPRLEIRDLYNLEDPKLSKQWTLFCLSYLCIQYPERPIPLMNNSSLSAKSLLQPGGDFFSIGGIHGLPYERWPGDPASDQIYQGKTDQAEAKIDPANIKPVHISADQPHEQHVKGADDQPITPGDPSIRYGGYCNHGSIHFPSWHRPYMLAIEQSIGNLATAIAKEFGTLAPGEAAEWAEAATCLRFPFWDWTIIPTEGEPIIPSVLVDEEVTVVGPGGEKTQLPNPIHSFQLEKYIQTERCRQFADVTVEIPWSGGQTQTGYYRSWHRTVRWPVDSAQAQDQPDKITDNMTERFAELRNKVAHMFSLEDPTAVPKEYWPHQWDRFSNTTVASNGPFVPQPPAVSLESPHNWMHLILGGMGHMGQNEYAGLDPIFYLHHGNVDRLYALWEWVYPEYRPQYGWYNPSTGQVQHFDQPQGTFIQLPKSRLDQWSDMLPWRNGLDSYWTLDDVSLENREKWPQYYTYPPIAGIDLTKPAPNEAARMAARAKLQSLFNLGAKENVKVVDKNPSPIFQTAPRHGGYNSVELEQLGHYRHFAIAVALSETVFNESYTLELSCVIPGAGVWRGHSAVLTRPIDSPCEGCQRRRAAGTKVKDLIHIPAPRVAAILDALPDDRPKTEQDEIYTLKRLIKGSLIGRDGSVYAHTVSPDTTVKESELLPADLAPQLRFMTAYAGVTKKVKAADAPVELYGWQDFDEVFDGARWKMGPPPQTGPDASY